MNQALSYNNRFERFLTKREAQYLHLFLKGFTNKEIAYDLSISVKSVEGIRGNLMKKWLVKGDFLIAQVAIDLGYTELLIRSYETKRIQTANLTTRESQVIRFLCKGFNTKEIGLKLGISSRTVEWFKMNIREKWNAVTGCDLMYGAIINGYVPVASHLSSSFGIIRGLNTRFDDTVHIRQF